MIKRHFFLPLVYLLLFGGIIWFYQNNSQFQQTADIGIHQVEVLTYNGLNRLTNKKVNSTTQQTDSPHSQADQSTGRWKQPTATIYVDLNNGVLRNATESAISQWNQTGAFTFRQVTDKQKADITVTTINEKSDNAAGLTNTSMNSLTGYYTHATVQLNAGYLLDPDYGYSQQRIINTAEHELGHAIGLQHNSGASVMQPAGSFYTIQPVDVQNVKKLYANAPQGDNNQQQSNSSSTTN